MVRATVLSFGVIFFLLESLEILLHMKKNLMLNKQKTLQLLCILSSQIAENLNQRTQNIP